MPLELVVADGVDPASGCAKFENSANGDGPVFGREFEIAELLRFIRHEPVVNVMWLTAEDLAGEDAPVTPIEFAPLGWACRARDGTGSKQTD
jgi:hypothetical protein